VIDPTQTPVLNRAFRDWSTDFFIQLKANNMSAVCSFSQELVQPPDNPAGGAVWVQRFPRRHGGGDGHGIRHIEQFADRLQFRPQNYLGRPSPRWRT